jgi:hypothetical protein
VARRRRALRHLTYLVFRGQEGCWAETRVLVSYRVALCLGAPGLTGLRRPAYAPRTANRPKEHLPPLLLVPESIPVLLELNPAGRQKVNIPQSTRVSRLLGLTQPNTLHARQNVLRGRWFRSAKAASLQIGSSRVMWPEPGKLPVVNHAETGSRRCNDVQSC